MAQAAPGSSTISAPVTVIRPPSPGSGRYAPEHVIPGARRALAPFPSPRAIEWHLRKVLTKLDISSRQQLQRALPDGANAVPLA